MQVIAKQPPAKVSFPKISVSRIILPSEHGSWSLLFEPLLTGFAIAFSPASPWVALMTIGAFFARQALKTCVLARKNHPLAKTAGKFLSLFVLIAGAGFFGVVVNSSPWAFFPLLVATPLATQQLVLDISTRGRSLVAELAGAVAISSSIAVMALADEIGLPGSIALWVVLTGRFVPSILYVRNRLLIEKGKRVDRISPNLAHVVSSLIVTVLAAVGLASFFTVGVFVFLLIRSMIGLSGIRKGTNAMVIGIWEVVFGALTIASIIAGYYAGI